MPDSWKKTGVLNLDALLCHWGDRPALVGPEETLTFLDVRNRLLQVIEQLQAFGVQKGHRVALHAPNSSMHIILLLAAWAIDFIFLPLDPKGPAGIIPAGITPDWIIVQKNNDRWFGNVISTTTLDGWSNEVTGLQSLETISLEQECAIVFTSGSTGSPKGVVHTVGNYLYSAQGTVEFLDMGPEDSWLVSLPLFHVGGQLIFVRTLLCGGMSLIHDDPGDLASPILERSPTILSLVPTQLQRLMEIQEVVEHLRECKAVILGGAPCPRSLMDKALDAGIPVLSTYGSTEACAMVTLVKPGSGKRAHYTAGQVLPYREVNLGEDGCVAIGGQTLLKHYIADGKPQDALKGGCFHTSDLGKWDDDGNLVIMGRRDLVFQSGGENINPQEIEKALEDAGLALEALVVPVPDELFGYVPWAFVKADRLLDERQMRQALKHVLAPYKVPKRILPLDSDTGMKGVKRDRKALEKLARKEKERA